MCPFPLTYLLSQKLKDGNKRLLCLAASVALLRRSSSNNSVLRRSLAHQPHLESELAPETPNTQPPPELQGREALGAGGGWQWRRQDTLPRLSRRVLENPSFWSRAELRAPRWGPGGPLGEQSGREIPRARAGAEPCSRRPPPGEGRRPTSRQEQLRSRGFQALPWSPGRGSGMLR